jgi:hypothetical protein
MSEMQQSEFERALTRAMARVNPPETLTKFLLKAAEVEAQSQRPRREPRHKWAWRLPQARFQSFGWMSGALAAVLLVGVFGVEQVHVRHEREQAAQATQQFETAMRVTDHALDQTRAQLQRAGIKLP